MMQFSSRCKLRQATATPGDNDQESLSHEDIRKDLEGLNESANVDEEKRETTITLIQQKFIDSCKDTLDKMDIKTCQSLYDIVPDGTITWLQKPKLPKVKRGQQIAPEYFHQRSVGLWHPAKMYASMNNRMPCPYCNQKAHLGEPLVSVSGDDGFWAPNYREIAGATANWFLVARKYKCKKCNKEFRNTSEDVLRLCPADVRIRFGLTLTPRHGIETEVSQRLSQLWLKSPAWAADAFNEAQVRNHNRLEYFYYASSLGEHTRRFDEAGPNTIPSFFQKQAVNSTNMLKSKIQFQPEKCSAEVLRKETAARELLEFDLKQIKSLGEKKIKILKSALNISTVVDVFHELKNILDTKNGEKIKQLSTARRERDRTRVIEGWKELLETTINQILREKDLLSVEYARMVIQQRNERLARDKINKESAEQAAEQASKQVDQTNQSASCSNEEETQEKSITAPENFGNFDMEYNGYRLSSKFLDELCIDQFKGEARPLLREIASYSARYIAIDCTFRFPERCKLRFQDQDKSFRIYQPYQALLTISNEHNQIIFYCGLANSENEREIREALGRFVKLRQEMHGRDYRPECIWTDTCCGKLNKCLSQIFKGVPIKLDLFHWLKRWEQIMVKSSNESRAPRTAFMTALANAVLQRDHKRVKQVQQEHKSKSNFTKDRLINQAVETRIPQPEVLYKRIMEVFKTHYIMNSKMDLSADLLHRVRERCKPRSGNACVEHFGPYPNGFRHGLFLSKTATGVGLDKYIAGLFEHVHKGCLSDPPGLVLQTKINGKNHLVGNRGTNANEVFHRMLNQAVASATIGIVRADALLTKVVAKYNRSRMIEIKGLPSYLIHQPFSHHLTINSLVNDAFNGKIEHNELPYPDARLPLCVSHDLHMGFSMMPSVGSVLESNHIMRTRATVVPIFFDSTENSTLAHAVEQAIAVIFAFAKALARPEHKRKAISYLQKVLRKLTGGGVPTKTDRSVLDEAGIDKKLKDHISLRLIAMNILVNGSLFTKGENGDKPEPQGDIGVQRVLSTCVEILEDCISTDSDSEEFKERIKISCVQLEPPEHEDDPISELVVGSSNADIHLHIGCSVRKNITNLPKAQLASAPRVKKGLFPAEEARPDRTRWIAFCEDPLPNRSGTSLTDDVSWERVLSENSGDDAEQTVECRKKQQQVLSASYTTCGIKGSGWARPRPKDLIGASTPCPFKMKGKLEQQDKVEQDFYLYLLKTKNFNRKAASVLSNSFESFAQLWNRYACPAGDLDGLFLPKLDSVQISHPGDLREYLKPKTAFLLRQYADFLNQRDSISAKNRKLMLASKLEHMTEPLVDVPVTADGALVHPLHLLESIRELDYSTRCNLEANIINEELLSRHPSLERFDTAELRSIMTKNFPLAPQQTFFQFKHLKSKRKSIWRAPENLSKCKYCQSCYAPREGHPTPFGAECKLQTCEATISALDSLPPTDFFGSEKRRAQAITPKEHTVDVPKVGNVRGVKMQPRQGGPVRTFNSKCTAFWKASAKVFSLLKSSISPKHSVFTSGKHFVHSNNITMNHTFLEFGMCQRLFLDSHGNLPCSESTNPESFGEPLSWMQGDAMDAWCATCCEENRVMKPAERKKCHGTAFVPSTALQFLTSSVDDRHDLFISSVCNAIANATPRGHFQKDSSSTRSIYIPDVIEYVMLPFCTGSHWQLLYFNQRQARVVFYDPLSTLHEPSHVMKVFGDAIRLFGAEDWEIEIRRGNQKNGVDCGYHVSTLMYTLWRGDVAEEVAHQEIQDEHMNEVYRRAFAMDIVRGIWRVYNISYLQVYWAARSDARGSTHLNLILAAIKNPNQAMSSQSQAQAPQISATEFSSQVAVTVS